MSKVFKEIAHYLSLVKFSHTIFAMPFAIVGFFLGANEVQYIPWHLFIKVIACMVFARSAAMAFNRYIDRRYDSKNQRTAQREIPAGKISVSSARLFIAGSVAAFIITTWFINRLCFFLSPVAVAVVLGYSLTKRFTALCHLVLGVGLALAPIGAYIAVTNQFAILPLCFSGIILFWTAGFDIIYALQDEEFDRSENLHSIPVLMGRKGALAFSTFLHVLTALLVLFAGWYGGFGFVFWIGAAGFIGLLIYQHILVSPSDISRVNLAFATTNGIAGVVFGLFVVSSVLIAQFL